MRFLKTLEAILLGAVLNWGAAKADFPIQPVCNVLGEQRHAKVCGSKVVWEDYRNGADVPAIYGKNIGDSNDVRISSNLYLSNRNPDIEGNDVFWARDNRFGWDGGFSMKNWDGEQINLSINASFTSGPKVSDKRFAWAESRDFFDPNLIRVYDYVNRQTIFDRECAPGELSSPSIFRDNFVFEDVSFPDWNIYLLNLTTREQKKIDSASYMSYPVIGERYIAYQKEIDGKYQVMKYNISSEEKKQITFQGNNRYATTFGGVIAYVTDRFGANAIMAYDDINGERSVTNNGNLPDLGKNYISFQRKGTDGKYDIWVAKNLLGADVNGDCRVNILDLISVRNKLGQNPDTGENWKADVNLDGKINLFDLIYVRNNLGKRCD